MRQTTTGRAIIRLTEPSEGSIVFHGENLASLSGEALRRKRRDLQIIFQDPYASLNPRMTIGSILEEPLYIHGLASGPERKQRVREMLEIVGLSPLHYNRYPHDLSVAPVYASAAISGSTNESPRAESADHFVR